jgi:protein kinase
MEKYQNPKTIGDGTYGSVIKAVNSQNGTSAQSTKFTCLGEIVAIKRMKKKYQKWD